MKQFTKTQFANKIRMKHPGSYEDLSDEKLVELWLKKFPNDSYKVIDNESSSFQDVNTFKEITNYLLMWIGIVLCFLSAVGFFVSTEWAVKFIIEHELEFGTNDSEASKLIYLIGVKLVETALWLKKLPVIVKIIGVISGGILWLKYNEAD
jgi:hypothetical protein